MSVCWYWGAGLLLKSLLEIGCSVRFTILLFLRTEFAIFIPPMERLSAASMWHTGFQLELHVRLIIVSTAMYYSGFKCSDRYFSIE